MTDNIRAELTETVDMMCLLVTKDIQFRHTKDVLMLTETLDIRMLD